MVDQTSDASAWGLFAFGLYAADDPRINSTMSYLRRKLWVNTDVGGMARYEGDNYHRVSDHVPGNPWFICTLWMADFLAERAEDETAIGEAVRLLEWAAAHALPSGVLPEQVHPLTGSPLSVSPLMWSHATLVATAHRVLRRLEKIKLCPECGLAVTRRSPEEHWINTLYADTCDTIYKMCRV